MAELDSLLSRAFEKRGNKNRYKEGEWEISFETRPFETLFWIYKDGTEVAQGNTRGEIFSYSTHDRAVNNAIETAFHNAMPEYRSSNPDWADFPDWGKVAINDAVERVHFVEKDSDGGKFVELYADYRDTADFLLQTAYDNKNNPADLRDLLVERIAENYEDTILETEDEILRQAGFDLDDSRPLEYFRDHYDVRPPYSHFLSQEIKVNLLLCTPEELNQDFSLIHEQYLALLEEQPDYTGDILSADTPLTRLVVQQGYSLEQLKAVSVDYNRDFYETNPPADRYLDGAGHELPFQKQLELFNETHPKFLTYVWQELENQSYSMAALTVLAKMSLEDYVTLMQPDAEITVPVNAMIGLHNPWNGSGSVLGIELDKPFTFSRKDIYDAEIEGAKSDNGWTVDQISGLVGTCWKEPLSIRNPEKEGLGHLPLGAKIAAAEQRRTGPTSGGPEPEEPTR